MTNEIMAASTKASKKETRRVIYEKLVDALQDYRTGIKEKKFEANLKKASRMFAADLAKGKKEKKEKNKKKKVKVKKEVINATNGVV
jgi:hypothetical protein